MQTVAAVAEPTPAPAPEPTPAVEPTPEPQGKIALAPKGAVKGSAPVHAAAPAPAKVEGPAKMTEKDLAAAPTGPAGDLGAAIKKEVGDKEQKPAAAVTDGTPSAGNVPQKPSQGAITGALGAVLGGARACVGPDDPISRATVTFASAGNVTSVTVSGGAVGKPAEGCIKAALSKAKVAPFAEASYSAPVTIRH